MSAISRPRRAFLLLALLWALLALVPAATAGSQAGRTKSTARPIWSLAMDWPRVAYVSGTDGAHDSIHVWNVATGSISTVKGVRGQGSAALHHAGNLAISGRRLAWIKTLQTSLSDLDRWLYTATVGGRAHLLMRADSTTDTFCAVGGPQIEGPVGSSSLLATSLWTASSDGASASDQRLELITSHGLTPAASGSQAVVAQSASGSHIAVLPLQTAVATPDGCTFTQPASAYVYGKDGSRLGQVDIAPQTLDSALVRIAISGDQLAVITAKYQGGQAVTTLSVYDWTTGTLEHTWPIPIHDNTGFIRLSIYGNLASLEGPGSLRLINLASGKDVVLASASHTDVPAPMGPHGLVYAVSAHRHGKLVFVPIARLQQLAG